MLGRQKQLILGWIFQYPLLGLRLPTFSPGIHQSVYPYTFAFVADIPIYGLIGDFIHIPVSLSKYSNIIG